jgi:hypothetical protein
MGGALGARMKFFNNAADDDQKLSGNNDVANKIILGTAAGAGLGYFADDIYDTLPHSEKAEIEHDQLQNLAADTSDIKNALFGGIIGSGAGYAIGTSERVNKDPKYIQKKRDLKNYLKMEELNKNNFENYRIKKDESNKYSKDEIDRLEKKYILDKWRQKQNQTILDPLDYDDPRNAKEKRLRDLIRKSGMLAGVTAGAGLTYASPISTSILRVPLYGAIGGLGATTLYDQRRKINYLKKENELIKYLANHPEEEKKFIKEIGKK